MERAAVPDEVLWRDEVARRRALRHDVFPDVQEETVILANFNQTYKICPTTFKLWIEILERVPNAILWLLRFPPQAEEHLRRTARLWGGEEVERRLRFTDVVDKTEHILRTRVADLFLDTTEVRLLEHITNVKLTFISVQRAHCCGRVCALSHLKPLLVLTQLLALACSGQVLQL